LRYVTRIPAPFRRPGRRRRSSPYALLYDGKRRVHHADDAMARITAERLIQHLERCGFVLMRSKSSLAPTTAIMPSSIG
jgi:hypothetical protein